MMESGDWSPMTLRPEAVHTKVSNVGSRKLVEGPVPLTGARMGALQWLAETALSRRDGLRAMCRIGRGTGGGRRSPTPLLAGSTADYAVR